MAVPRSAQIPLGLGYLAMAALIVGMWVYIVADTVYPFRRCTFYWVYLTIGVTLLFLVPPVAYFCFMGFKYLHRRRGGKKKVGTIHTEGINKQLQRVAYILLLLTMLFLAVLVIVNFGLVLHYAINSRASRSSFTVDSLADDTQIRRGSGNIPYISARSLSDAATALGVAHATDRLFQMDFLRRAARGTLAASFGSKFTDADRFFRTLGIGRAADRDYEALNEDQKAIVDRYTAGVNAYRDAKGPSPFEKLIVSYDIEEWTSADSLAVLKLLQWRWSGSMHREMLRYTMLVDRGLDVSLVQELLPLYPEDAATSVPLSAFSVSTPARQRNIRQEDATYEADKSATADFIQSLNPDAEGTVPEAETADDLYRHWDLSLTLFHRRPISSSAMLVTRQLTVGQTEAPKVGFTLDGTLSAPSEFYPAGITLSDSNNTMFGPTVPGIPAILSGRGANHVFTATPSWADVQDLYVIDDNEQESYTYQGETTEYTTREETIEVAGGDAQTITVRETVFGPVVSDVWESDYRVGSRPLALRWTGLDADDTSIAGWWGLATATNDEQFFAAAERIQAPPVSLLYARQGASYLVHGGRVPLRRTTEDAADGEGHTGLFPADGSTADRVWQGYADAPVVVENRQNYMVATDARVMPRGAPVFLGYEQGWTGRISRLSELVEENIDGDLVTTVSAQDLSEYISDVRSATFPLFFPLLQDLSGLNGRGTQTKERLSSWEGNMAVNSENAFQFHAWVRRLGALPSVSLPVTYWTDVSFLSTAYTSEHAACRDQDSSCQDLAAQQLNDLSEREAWGSSKHKGRFDHPMFSRSHTAFDCMCSRVQNAPGDAYSVSAVAAGSAEDNYDAHSGVTYWQVADLRNSNADLFLMPLGISGVQWSNGDYDRWGSRWGRRHFLRLSAVDTESDGQKLNP